MMSVLITGARGMLGQALARSAPQGVSLTLWDRDECDLTKREDVLGRVGSLASSWIVNCAAYNAVDRAEQERDAAFAVNRDAVAYLRDAARSRGARLIHLGTDYVFDGTKKEGYTEEDVPNPLSVYGASKAAGEKEALKSLDAIVVRTSRLFGRTGAGKKSFVDIILEQAQGASGRFEVVDAEASSPTFADDLARALWNLVATDANAGIYHRTNHGACTRYEFAKEIVRLHSLSVTIVPIAPEALKRPAARPPFSVLCSTKLPPLRHWKEALRDHVTTDS